MQLQAENGRTLRIIRKRRNAACVIASVLQMTLFRRIHSMVTASPVSSGVGT
jgi:hypothetical protein